MTFNLFRLKYPGEDYVFVEDAHMYLVTMRIIKQKYRNCDNIGLLEMPLFMFYETTLPPQAIKHALKDIKRELKQQLYVLNWRDTDSIKTELQKILQTLCQYSGCSFSEEHFLRAWSKFYHDIAYIRHAKE